MKIGNLSFDNPIFLAPMAGYTDVAFRSICEECGADMCYSEMVSAKGLYYGSEKTEGLLSFEDNTKFKAIQIFGNDSEVMAEICKKLSSKCHLIDINMGCPAPKIFKNGEGSALMNDFATAEKVISACVKSSSVPVTVKFRLGVKQDSFVGVEFAEMCERAGASAITVHGRFTEQFYSGSVDYEKISQIVKAVSIPVIGSGDIVDRQSLEKMRACGVQGVMIGRASVGNPQIFSTLNGKECSMTKLEAYKKHVQILRKYFSDDYIVKYMRKHIVGYLAGIEGVNKIKREVLVNCNLNEVMSIMENVLE